MIYINGEDQFNKEIKNGLVLLDFYASWCGPCRMLTPVLEELEETNKQIKILKIDVDEEANVELVRKFNIQSIPALFLIKEGKVTKSSLGYITLDQLNLFIK